ncbi:hypothetical protein [Marinobacterium lutimaris]|uniref:Di-and tricarboxylate transporter n=1 Tax=Marinobacterium lutimaris TaxID=568106 RepID=A0A1H5YU66_9GAMM|nr:hypothetical protein [Marinobacterium lutimaris]SEG27753.1 hypothetical protein SAMN05444390_1011901 [Marinobacterium lutimaris]
MNTANTQTLASPASLLPGIVLLTILPLSIVAAFNEQIPGYLAGIPAWVALFLLIARQQRGQMIQRIVLLSIGLTGLALSLVIGSEGGAYLLKALEANQMIISMLVAVSFLRLVTLSGLEADDQLPPGNKALQGTLFGGHLIASVINMSSVMILGDRLSANRPLNSLQGLILLRSFSICAVWSPFFAAMGVILISAPGASLTTLVIYGIPVALAGLLMTSWQISRHPQAATTQGYPLHFGALWIPMLLAVLVMIAHNLWPEVSVITLVTLLSLLFTLLWLPVKTGSRSPAILAKHVRLGLPRLGGEVTLFVAAAVLAAGIGALLLSLDIRLAPEHFGPLAACITLAVLIALAMIGMHPVTSAVLAGSILMPSVDDPNLLGITLLLSWSLGVGLSPFSGVQISLQSRYGISALTMLRMNRFYAPTMIVIGFCTINLYSYLHG